MREWINLINEALDTVIVPSWHDRSQDGFSIIEAEMMIKGSLLRISFKRYMHDPEWSVSFYRNGKYSMTGEGSAFTIFGAVSRVVEEFVRTRRPLAISMSSMKTDTSRTSLYRKLAREFIQKFPEYQMSELDTWKSTIFELTKDGGPDPIATEYRGEPVTGEENKPKPRTAAQKARDAELLARLYDELDDM